MQLQVLWCDVGARSSVPLLLQIIMCHFSTSFSLLENAHTASTVGLPIANFNQTCGKSGGSPAHSSRQQQTRIGRIMQEITFTINDQPTR
jgi:hypothetical protein